RSTISTLPAFNDFWKACRMDFVRSVDPSSDAIGLQFLRVCVPSEANCWARKRSPLRVQRRIITRRPIADGQIAAVPGVVFAGHSSQIRDSLDTTPLKIPLPSAPVPLAPARATTE